MLNAFRLLANGNNNLSQDAQISAFGDYVVFYLNEEPTSDQEFTNLLEISGGGRESFLCLINYFNA